ncbi:hypothetical protein NO357_09315 [Marimonas arenosa]|uniref:Uncharacterized protein n=2 Tax=Marimonas arenosa TaxID=1795305 RepID=A0AAE4B4C6_9RHOB|nr:DUF2946 family protein [Marimonas arenosa]MDQ2090095.1 hypothetical protein [Marimonas arenosa]
MLALVISQSVPLAAQERNSGVWIEICSEFGPVMKKVDLSGDEDADEGECPACATCPFCALPEIEAFTAAEASPTRAQAARERAVHGAQTLIANPAQFWPDNRGPPFAQPMQRHGMHDVAKAPVFYFAGGPWT